MGVEDGMGDDQVVRSSGNVFADLGLPDAEKLDAEVREYAKAHPVESPEQPSMSTGDAQMEQLMASLRAEVEREGVSKLGNRILRLLDHIEGKGK